MRNIKFLAFLICALLLFPLSASAGEASAPPSIVDNGGCLSDSDENSLTQKINDLKAQYPVDIVIVTEKRRKASTVQEEADDLFDKSEGIQEATPEPNISGGYTPNSDTVSKPKAAEEKKPPSPSDYIITALVVGLILTVIYMARLKKQMKTANKQKNADVYRRNDQAIHIDKKDILLTSRVTRKPLSGNPTHIRNGERHGGSTGTF